jgi:hypothetical protein
LRKLSINDLGSAPAAAETQQAQVRTKQKQPHAERTTWLLWNIPTIEEYLRQFFE